MASSDWRTKYLDIRAKLLEATDVAYRLGFEEGAKQAKQAQVEQQQAQEQAMMEQQAAMQQAGADGGISPEEQAAMEAQGGLPEDMADAPMPEDSDQMPGEEEGAGGGSELDQHIDELQSLVAKGEKPSVLAMRKAVDEIANIRKSQKNKWAKKVEKTTNSQKRFVNDIIKKWEKESKEVSENIEDVLETHGLKVEEE